METILKVENLGVRFGEDQVLKNLDFSVNKGDVLAIVGPNGAGKSVLFRTLLGLLPYSGKFEWAKDLKISYIPQKLAIDRELPLSVGEFIKFKQKDKAKIINIVLDNLNTHNKKSFVQAFDKEKAKKIMSRIRFYYTRYSN